MSTGRITIVRKCAFIPCATIYGPNIYRQYGPQMHALVSQLRPATPNEPESPSAHPPRVPEDTTPVTIHDPTSAPPRGCCFLRVILRAPLRGSCWSNHDTTRKRGTVHPLGALRGPSTKVPFLAGPSDHTADEGASSGSGPLLDVVRWTGTSEVRRPSCR